MQGSLEKTTKVVPDGKVIVISTHTILDKLLLLTLFQNGPKTLLACSLNVRLPSEYFEIGVMALNRVVQTYLTWADEESASAIIMSAEEGNTASQYIVGSALMQAGNINQAFVWFHKAAARGYRPALVALRTLPVAPICNPDGDSGFVN